MPIIRKTASDYTAFIKANTLLNQVVSLPNGSYIPRVPATVSIVNITGLTALVRNSPFAIPPVLPDKSITLENAGGSDVFIVKYTTDGGLLWAARISGIGNDKSASVSTDSDGNVYVAGSYTTDVTVVYDANGVAFGEPLPSVLSDASSFLVKYTKDGAVVWKTHMDSEFAIFATSLAVYSTNQGTFICVTGSYRNNANFYSVNGTSNSGIETSDVANVNGFFATYDSNGNFPYIARVDGESNRAQIIGMSVDAGDNTLVCGEFQGPTHIYDSEGGEITPPLPNDIDGWASYLIKWQSMWGSVIWKTFIEFGRLTSISTDADSNVYAVGDSTSTNIVIHSVDEEATPPITVTRDSPTPFQFLIKFDMDGQCLWAVRLENVISEFFDTNNNVYSGTASDSAGNTCITGAYSSGPLYIYDTTDDVDPVKSLPYPTEQTYCSYVVMYNTSGEILWAANMVPSVEQSYDAGLGASIDFGGNVFVTGSYINDLILNNADGSPAIVLPGIDGFETFIVKYSPTGRVLWASRGKNPLAVSYGSSIRTDVNGVYVMGTYGFFGYVNNAPITFYPSGI